MFFSVIIPVYNAGKYLAPCVDSVLSQTDGDFEVILVDDGSTDGSGALCDGYAAKDPRVRVLHKENGGQSTARNMGLRAAGGEYVVFLDSDDFLLSPGFLADLRGKAGENPDVILYKYQKYWEDKGLSDCAFSFAGIGGEQKQEEMIRELVKRDAFFCSAWSKSVRCSLLKENGFYFDESLSCEDMDWYYQVLEKAGRIALLDRSYIAYRQRPGSVTAVVKEKTIADFIRVLERWSDRFQKGLTGRRQEVMLQSMTKLYCNLLVAFVRYRGENRKGYRERVRGLAFLFRYDSNARAKKFAKIYRLAGFRGLLFFLKLADQVR